MEGDSPPPAREDSPGALLPTVVEPLLVLPRPRPVIIPERLPDGGGFCTNSLRLTSAGGGFYLGFTDVNGLTVRIHLVRHQLERLVSFALGPEGDMSGQLWRRLSEIPLERPLPNRALEEELRVLLRTFAVELAQPTRR